MVKELYRITKISQVEGMFTEKDIKAILKEDNTVQVEKIEKTYTPLK